jgi:N-glycosylase/DNA lyase
VLLDTRNNNESNTERRFDFLKSSKNNKRIYNIKKSRIEKLNKLLQTEKKFLKYENNLENLNEILAKTM